MLVIPELVEPGQFAVRRRGQWTLCHDRQLDRPLPPVVYPGAFHPLHAGHRRIAEIASARLAATVEYEISLINVDKPGLAPSDVEQRLRQFPRDAAIWLTQAPTFVEKSRLFPGAVFVVGADTLIRIIDARYYADDPAAAAAAVAEIAGRGCRFLVFGRRLGDRFWTLDDVAIPETLRQRCAGVSAEEFRMDVSSTHLRGQPDDRSNP